MNENEISKLVVTAAIEAHRTLGGPGLLESVYEEALAYELTRSGCNVRRQVLSPLLYKDITLATPLKIDLLVNDLVIVECKAVTRRRKVAKRFSEHQSYTKKCVQWLFVSRRRKTIS